MIVTLVVLAAFAIAAFPSIKTSFSQEPKVIPEDLDLNSVRDAIIEKLGWSSKRANAARFEYLRFLTLLQMKPGFMLVPWPNEEGQDDVDQFWHQHILDTAKYASDCDRLFGRMIHHNPHVVRGSGQETDAVEKTQRLYARTFGSGSYGRTVDAEWVAACGSCAATDTASESHGSGHGGHGHGDGGHGGGHSCGGGHGCGHGCGGH